MITDRSSLFTNIARAMSRNWQVNVVPSGYECCTDGDTIKYPFNADHLKDADQKVLHGLLDHETAHVADERDHADAGQITPLQLCRKCRTNREKMLLNVFEDIRIEHKYSARYPGMAENLAAANLNSVRQYQQKSDHSKNFWHTLGCGIIFAAHGLDTSWMPAEFTPYMDAVADEIAAGPKSRWGSDSLALARSAIKKIGDKAEELEQPEQQKGEPQQKGEQGQDADQAQSEQGQQGESEGEQGEQSGSAGDEGDEADGESSAAGDEDDEDAAEDQDSGESKGEDEGEDKDAETGSGGASEDSGGEGDEAAREAAAEAGRQAMLKDADNGDLMELAKEQVIDAARADGSRNRRYSAHPQAAAADAQIIPHTRADSNLEYNVIKEKVAAQIRGLKGKLTTVIRARAASKLIGDQRSGELDSSRLASVRTGNRAVFQVEEQGEKLDTAISILIDLSGSMGNGDGNSRYSYTTKAYQAKLMAVALGETFAALNIPFEIIGFHTRTRDSIRCERDGYSRMAPMEYHMFKAFSESYRKVRSRLTTITGRQDNVDCEAVMMVAERLAKRSETRKIMFVLSDGQPAGGGVAIDTNEKALKEAIQKITRSGIEVIGIGAQTRTVQDFYNERHGATHVIVNDIEALAVEVYKLMRSQLLKGKKGVAA